MLNGNGLIKRGPWCRDHDRDQIVAWRHDHRSFKCSHEHSPMNIIRPTFSSLESAAWFVLPASSYDLFSDALDPDWVLVYYSIISPVISHLFDLQSYLLPSVELLKPAVPSYTITHLDCLSPLPRIAFTDWDSQQPFYTCLEESTLDKDACVYLYV